ncbi:DUF6153 family protein [Streptomyces cinnabarinus]|uniref:DUF6153 family protein n=1 Tax=Streptomyces cinnabarinus TaxID=67287 RepID=A0ABY7KMA9_9ACTN|nr:DUF6153 family protein [Streptomyces cinnabarinus]WAZ24710.1 DUF6153 family protein [Streptomyces cinnabarinus]
MRANRYVRAGSALGQLLLVVVLALGVFVMHTVGHPEESSSHSGMQNASHAAPMDHPAAHDPDGSSTHEPAMPMDMASLCVAVLFGAWVLAALLRSAFTRHGEWLARLLAQVASVLRPNPPPRGPDLTQLSVLRQ